LKILLLVILFINTSAVKANEPLIYGESYEGAWFPLTYIINGTIDVAQNDYWFNQKKFSEKTRELNRRLENPHRSIKNDGGYGKLFKNEFLSTRVFPNILLHTLGGGYDTLWLKEYYDNHDYPAPWVFAIFTSFLARYGNEVLEVTEKQITSHDHIADLFFFDVAGVFLAQNPEWMKFLVKDLGMTAWHFQPMWAPKEDDFRNAGLNYIIRPEVLSYKEKVTPFFFFGMQNMLGISYQYDDKRRLSVSTGLFFTDPLEQKSKLVSALFWEKKSELVASFFINGSENFRWRLNMYPALFGHQSGLHVGLLIAETYERQNYAVGVNLNLPFGLLNTF